LGKVGLARFRKNPEESGNGSEDVQDASNIVQPSVIKTFIALKTRNILTAIRKNPEISGKAFLIYYEYYEPLSPPHKKCFDLALVEPTSPPHRFSWSDPKRFPHIWEGFAKYLP
jgi:hypothetical protein